MDVKEMLLSGMLGVVAGGGVYGLYVKWGATAAVAQLDAHMALTECIALSASPDHPKGRQFLKDVPARMPSILKAEMAGAVVSTLSSASAGRTDVVRHAFAT